MVDLQLIILPAIYLLYLLYTYIHILFFRLMFIHYYIYIYVYLIYLLYLLYIYIYLVQILWSFRSPWTHRPTLTNFDISLPLRWRSLWRRWPRIWPWMCPISPRSSRPGPGELMVMDHRYFYWRSWELYGNLGIYCGILVVLKRVHWDSKGFQLDSMGLSQHTLWNMKFIYSRFISKKWDCLSNYLS